MKEPTRVIDEYGAIIYSQNGQRNRENGPVYISPDGYMAYRKNGDLHREDGPAVIFDDGSMYYYENGKCVKQVEP